MKQIFRPAIIYVFSAIFITGCGAILPPAPPVSKESEPNDTFAEAKLNVENSANPFELEGTLSEGFDYDIFNLGKFDIGETIKIELRSSQALTAPEITIGLFDGDEDVARLEDSITPETSLRTVFTHTIRKAGEYFLGISAGDTFIDSPFDYVLRISTGSANPPAASGQTVYVNFNGGDKIWLDSDFYPHLLPFGSVSLSMNARELSQHIIDLMRLDYWNLNINIISSYAQSEPQTSHSTLYITGSDENYFGLAQSVDWYNSDHGDIAIVFAGALYDKRLSSDQFAQAVANVASHELGHLLGLVHTDDDTELMDAVTPLNLLEDDQDFHRAELDDFPVGYQDAAELLEMILGT